MGTAAPAAGAKAVTAAKPAAPALAPEMQARIDALQTRAGNLRPQLDAFIDVQDQIAASNFAQIDTLSRVGANPLSLPGQTDHLSVAQRQALRAMTEENTRMLRQDLRDGRTSAIVDPNDFVNASSPEEVKAIMRVGQAMQDAGIPRDFNGHSPTNMRELEQLQVANTGKLPAAGMDDAGWNAYRRQLEGKNENQADHLTERVRRNQEMAAGHGIDNAIPNPTNLPRDMEGILRERDAINAELKKLGRDPMSLGEFQASADRLKQLDDAIVARGKEMYEKFGGLQAGQPPFHEAPVTDLRERKTLADGSTARLTPIVQGDKKLGDALLPGGARGLGGTLERPLTPAQRDELVRINDSMGLLHGNHTGLSLRDVPMSQGLRDALGIDPRVMPDHPNRNPLDPLPDIFKKREDRMGMTEKIDRAALVPAEMRGDYLTRLSRETFGASLDEQNRTQLNQEFDNTTLNRIAEAVDPFAYILNRHKTDWIGPRAQIRGEQSKNIGKKIDGLTEGASHDVIYNRHGAAMQKLRQAQKPLEFHRGINNQYDAQTEASQMRGGLFLATLPLSVIPMAQGGRMLAQGGKRLLGTVGRGAAIRMARNAPLHSTRRALARGLATRLKPFTPKPPTRPGWINGRPPVPAAQTRPALSPAQQRAAALKRARQPRVHEMPELKTGSFLKERPAHLQPPKKYPKYERFNMDPKYQGEHKQLMDVWGNQTPQEHGLTVKFTPDEMKQHRVFIRHDSKGNPFVMKQDANGGLVPFKSGNGKAMYVMDGDGALYAVPENQRRIASGTIHHSSFADEFGQIATGGEFRVGPNGEFMSLNDPGLLTYTGHYKVPQSAAQRMIDRVTLQPDLWW